MADWTDEYMVAVLEKIKEFGWIVQGVAPDDGELGFAYTVGLFPACGQEFIAFGLPIDVTQRMFNNIGHLIHHEGREFKAGDTAEEVANVPVRFIDVVDPKKYLKTAMAIYGETNFHALQLVFPDSDGRWPNEDGYRIKQPILGVMPWVDN